MFAQPLNDDQTQPIRMTVEEYLAFEEQSDTKWEYARGSVYAMTGGTVRHGVISMNVGTQLNNALEDTDCSVTTPDVKVHIARRDAFRFPDVVVFCGDAAYLEGRTDVLTNPILLVEVLSPSSSVTDRNEKLEDYTHIDSLQAYLLVSQHEAKIERFVRQSDDEWLYTYALGLDSEIAIPPLHLTLALSKVYRRVTFDVIDVTEENDDNTGANGETNSYDPA